MTDPVAEAIERGGATGRVLVAHRDALIHHLAAVYIITGAEGLRACAAGAAEAVIIAHRKIEGEEGR
jgi:hypothetical protein